MPPSFFNNFLVSLSIFLIFLFLRLVFEFIYITEAVSLLVTALVGLISSFNFCNLMIKSLICCSAKDVTMF